MSELSKVSRPLKVMIKDEEVQKRFNAILGDNAPAFLMSVLNCTANSEKLATAEPSSVLMAAAVAATLNMPIDPNLGMAYIIPYVDRTRNSATFAQFQIGYKGLIALCHRSEKFVRINVEPVYDGELKSIDRLTGDIEFDWIQDNDVRNASKMIGVVAYFELTNGFKKTYYMSDAELEKHGKKYSQTYKKGFGLWKDDNIGMKKKTVLKLLIDKFAPKSVDMQKAIRTDQAVVGDYDANKLEFPDNQPLDVDQLNEQQEENRIFHFISTCEDVSELEQFENMGLSEANAKLLKSKTSELNVKK